MLERLVRLVRCAVQTEWGSQVGWGGVIQYGMTERVFAAKRGAVRIFCKFETLIGYPKGIGEVSGQCEPVRPGGAEKTSASVPTPLNA